MGEWLLLMWEFIYVDLGLRPPKRTEIWFGRFGQFIRFHLVLHSPSDSCWLW